MSTAFPPSRQNVYSKGETKNKKFHSLNINNLYQSGSSSNSISSSDNKKSNSTTGPSGTNNFSNVFTKTTGATGHQTSTSSSYGSGGGKISSSVRRGPVHLPSLKAEKSLALHHSNLLSSAASAVGSGLSSSNVLSSTDEVFSQHAVKQDSSNKLSSSGKDLGSGANKLLVNGHHNTDLSKKGADTADFHSPTSLAVTSSTVTSSTPATWKNSAAVKAFDSIRNPASRFLFEKSFNSAPPLPSQTHRVNFLNKDSPQFVNEFPSLGIVKSNEKLGSKNVGKYSSNTHSPEKSNINSLKGGFIDRDKTKLDSDDTSKHNSKSKYSATLFGKNGNNLKSSTANDQNSGTSGKYGPGPALRPQTVGNWNASNQTKHQQQKESTSPLTNTSGDNNSSGVGLNNRTKIQNSLIQTMPDASYITSHPPPSVHTVSNNSTVGTSSNSKFQNGGSKFFNSVTSSSNIKRGPTSINDFPNTSSSYNTNFLTNNSITMNNNGYQSVEGESSSAYQFGSFPQQEQNRDLIGSVGYTGRRHQQMDSNTNVVRPIMMSSKTSSRGVPPSSSSSFDNDNFKFDVMSTGYRGGGGGVNGQRHYQHADSSNNGPTSPQVQSKGLSVGPPHGGRRPSVSDDRRQRPQVGVEVNTWNGNRESEMKSTTGDDWTNMDDDFDFDKEIHSDEDEEVFSSKRPSEMDPRQSVSGHQPSAHRGGSVVVNSSTTVFPRAIDGPIRHNTNGSYSRNMGAEYNHATPSSVGSNMVPSSETPVEAVEYGDEKDVQEDEKDEERIEDYWFSRGGWEDGSDSHKSQVGRHLTPEECTSSRDASSKKINTNRRVDWTDSIDKVTSESTKKISSHQHSSSHMFVRDVRYPNDDRGVPSGAKHNIPSSPNKNNVVNRDQRNHGGSEPSEKRRGKGMLNGDSSLELVSNEHSKMAGHDPHRRPSTVSHGVKGDYGQRVTTSGKMKDNNKAKNDVKIRESDNVTNEKASSTSTTTSTATKPFDWSTFKVNQKGDLTSNNNNANDDESLSKSSFVNKNNFSNTHENTFSSSNGRKILQQQNVEKSGSSSPSSMISSSGGDFSSSLHHEPHQNTDESPFQRQQHVSKKSSHHSKVVPQSFRGNSNGHGEFEGTGGGKHRNNRRGGGEMGVSDDRDDGHHHARGGHSSGVGRGGRRGGPSNRNDRSSEVPPPIVSSSTRGRGSRGRGGVRNEKQYNNIMVNDASDKSHVTLTQRERRSKKDGLSSRPHTSNKNGAHPNTDGGGDVPPPVSDEMAPPPSLVARKAPLKGLMDIEIEMPPEMVLAKKGGKGGGVNTLLSQFSTNDHNDGESEKDTFTTSNKYLINDNFDSVKMENKHITDSMGRQSHHSDEVVVGQKAFDSSQQNNRAMNNNSEATAHEVNENFCNKLENTLVFENSMFSSSSKGSTVVFDNGMKSTNEEKSDAMCGVPSSMPNSVYSGTTNTNSLPLTSINDPNSAPFNDSKFSNWGPPTARPESGCGGGPGTADNAAGSKSSNGRDIRQSPAPSVVNNATTTRRTNRHIMSGDGMDEELASADDDLNFKIASVKKMWDISASGSLPPAAFENEHQTSRVRHHIPPPPTQLHTADGDLSSVSGKCSSSQVDQRLIVERPSSVMDAPSSSQSTCVVSVSGPVPPMKMFSPFAPPSSSSSTSRVASALVGGVSSSITGGENVAKVRPQPHFHAATDSATTHIGGSSGHASHMLNENGAYPMHHHHHHPSHHFNGGGSSSFMNKSSAAANTPFGPTTMFHSPAVGNPFGQAFHPHHHTGGYPGSSPFHHPHQQSSSALYEAFHYLNEARASGGGSVAASAHHSSHNAAANLYSQPPPSASMRLPPIGSKLAPVSSSSSSFLGAEKLIHSQQGGGGGGGPIGGQYGMGGGGGPSMGDPVSNGNGSSEFDAAFVAVAAALHHQQQQQQSKAAAAAALAAAAHLLPPPTSTNISSSSVVVAASNDPTPLVANSQSVPSNQIRNQESSKDSSGMIESRGSSNPQSTANSTAPSSGVVEESQNSNKGRDSQQRVNSNGGNNND